MTVTETPGSTPGTSRELVLEASGVTMRFGGLTAVDDVSMKVHEGEIVGLIGPNGAGKTTFFNCLTGMYIPTEGRVTLNGDTLPPKPLAVVRAGMARTFQNIRLFAQHDRPRERHGRPLLPHLLDGDHLDPARAEVPA